MIIKDDQRKMVLKGTFSTSWIDIKTNWLNFEYLLSNFSQNTYGWLKLKTKCMR